MRFFVGVQGTFMAYVYVVLLWIARSLRLYKVTNFEQARQAIEQGNVMFICNHPSLLETIAVPALFWPYPWQKKTHKVPYSVADINLFDRGWQDAFRLLVVSREETSEAAAINKTMIVRMLRILKDGGVVILYPEGTRTFKAQNHLSSNGRRVGLPLHELVMHAHKRKATIIPIWADHGDCSKERNLLTSYRMLYSGKQMTLHFGEPLTGEITPETVAQALLGAGREAG